ncbi:39S ribosomal protein L9, mitochondrial [Amphibalanus amphitrite]|uniref:Large ribosomal subunit protein bL9m n=1 Tax=Amphibalanus amphitrite TaxID=1232801 RepID=A0A6A4W7P6_AMPAM|nr:39S ribosomal protein L9, mitochondrial [Amphibalanus amphitrite]
MMIDIDFRPVSMSFIISTVAGFQPVMVNHLPVPVLVYMLDSGLMNSRDTFDVPQRGPLVQLDRSFSRIHEPNSDLLPFSHHVQYPGSHYIVGFFKRRVWAIHDLFLDGNSSFYDSPYNNLMPPRQNDLASLGKPGDTVSVKVTKAQNELLAFGRAVYASPENQEKYRNVAEHSSADEVRHSSIYSAQTAKVLSRQVLAVSMNLDQPWVLQPWHLSVAFRKAGFVVPEHCLQMPSGTIEGPDVEGLEGKEFIVTVTINNCEQVPVRCRLHHYATEPRDRLPYRRQPWLQPAEPVFPEEAERLAALPRPISKPLDGDDH